MNSIKNEKGITLVELVVGVAIMLVFATVVSMVVIITARNYKASTTQTILITEASNAKSQITNMIMDATDAVAYFGDLDAENTITIVRQGVDYNLHFSEEEKRLYLTLEESEEVLAEYVTSFKVDTSDYVDNKTVSFEINYEFEGMTYETSFQATSRNELPGEIKANAIDPYFKISPKELYLEPNQDYTLNAKLIGGDGRYTVSVIDSNTYGDTRDYNRTTAKVDKGLTKIHIGRNEKGNDSAIMYLKLESEEKRDNKPIASSIVTVRIRRVTGIRTVLHFMGGEPGKAGATYEATGFCFGTNLEKLNTNDETKKVDPKAIHGQFTLWVNGKDLGEGMFSYFDIVSMDDKNARIVFKKDMPKNSELHVQVIAQHPKGGDFNISGKEYGYFEDLVILKNPEDLLYPVIFDNELTRGKECLVRDQDGKGLFADQNILKGLGYNDINQILRQANNKRWIYRFREIKNQKYGKWVPFRSLIDTGGTAKLNVNETLRLEPDKYYQIQFVFAVFDSRAKKLYYPISDDLLKEPGFEGYTAGWSSTQPQMGEEYYTAADMYIAPVELTYEMGGFKDLELIGTITEPVKYKTSDNIQVILHTTNLEKKENLDIIFQKPGQGWDWDNVNLGLQVEKNAWINNERCSSIFFRNMQGIIPGRYRVLVGINWNIYKNGDNLTDTYENIGQYYDSTKYYRFYDDQKGKGMFYFNIER